MQSQCSGVIRAQTARAPSRSLLAALALLTACAPSAYGAGKIVISQVYGGGGNSGSTYKNDFIELFNAGDAPVTLSGWSLQYTSTTGNFGNNRHNLPEVTIQPGQYFLVQESSGGGGTVDLPTPDYSGNLSLSATGGKVALASIQTAISSCSDPAVVDLVSWGSTNCYEGSGPAPATTALTAVHRNLGGCQDVNDNSADFTVAPPNPRNSASPFNICGSTDLAGNGSADPSTVIAGESVQLRVAVSPASVPPSTGITVQADLSSINGSATQAFTETSPGSNLFIFNYVVPTNVTGGAKSLPVTITDAQARVAYTTIELTVNVLDPNISAVRINELFVNQSGTDFDEFIELQGPAGVSLSGAALLMIEGERSSNPGQIKRVVDLSSHSIPPDGFFVIGTTTATNVDYVLGTSDLFENGTETFLLVTGFTGGTGDDIDTNNDGVIDDSYTKLGNVMDSIGLAGIGLLTDPADLIYNAPIVGPVPDEFLNFPAGAARKTDGAAGDTDSANDWCITSFNNGSDGLPLPSPGVSNNGLYTCPPLPPFVLNQRVFTTVGASGVEVQLVAVDTVPGPQPVQYVIDTLPAPQIPTVQPFAGTLTDPNNGDAPVTAGTILAGSTVTLTPGATSGWYRFLYKATDDGGSTFGATAQVNVFIQDTGKVVITEIMYNPAQTVGENNSETGWEWVEVANIGSQTYGFKQLNNGSLNAAQNNNLDFDYSLAPGQVGVFMNYLSYETTPNFFDAWALLQDHPQVFIMFDGPSFPSLTNTGDIVFLFGTNGELYDYVQYGAGSGWPTSQNGASIYLKAGALTTVDNDLAENWARSAVGVDGAYQTINELDTGSPLGLPLGKPSADNQTVFTNRETPITITLTGTDPVPGPSPLSFNIVSAPVAVSPTTGASGTLTDPLDGDADVTTGGPLTGDQVVFTPAPGVAGVYQFTFSVNDGNPPPFATATVTVFVQDEDQVVITEIMYNPANNEPQWEWIEVYNPTGAPISLGTLWDFNNAPAQIGNLGGATIPAGAVRILMPDTVSVSEFVAEWSLSDGSAIVQVPAAQWPSLNNSNNATSGLADEVKLFDSAGRLLDVVRYAVRVTEPPNGWPASDGKGSIYVTFGNLSSYANDLPGSWALSTAGVDGAYATPETPGTPLDSDVGSPLVLPSTPSTDRTITAWRSVRNHGGAGNLAIVLNPTATGNGPSGPTVEPRGPSAVDNGIRRIEIDFSGAVTLGGAPAAAVSVVGRTTSGGVLGAPVAYVPSDVVAVDADTIALIFNAGVLPDATCYTITINPGVINETLVGDNDVQVRSLFGDANGSGEILLGDALLSKAHIGQPAASVAGSDVDLNGNVTLADGLLIKSRVASPSRKALCP